MLMPASTPAATASTATAAPAPVPVPARRSRVLKRKTDHSLIERRRRDKINGRLVALQSLVPACRAEALATLRAKPVPKALRAAREAKLAQQQQQRQRHAAQGTDGRPANKAKASGEWTQEEMDEKMQNDMVLEKLCIISHTYGKSSLGEVQQALAADGAVGLDRLRPRAACPDRRVP